MVVLEFLALSGVNLALVFFIVRRRGIASAEGLCMAYLALAAGSDTVALVFRYCFAIPTMSSPYREFAFRLFPTAVEIIGLVALIAGLLFSSSRVPPVHRECAETELLQLRKLGFAITAIGIAMAFTALRLVGAFHSPNFYAALGRFRSETLPFGGFWYRGADIAVFGLALTLPALRARIKLLLFTVALMMLVSFFLRTNKGGLEEPLIWAAIVLFVYNRRFLGTLLNVKTIALAAIIAFLGVSAKFWLAPRVTSSLQPALTSAELLRKAEAAAEARWGDSGLYRGYCQFISALPDNRGLFRGGKVGVYSLTSWVPRFVYPGKPDHPFRGLGFMIYSDFHRYSNETPAPMLAGSAMADNGFTSLLAYLFVAGLFLGYSRRFTAGSGASVQSHCGYLFFVLFGGLSAEEGTLGILYTLLLAWGVIFAARLLLLVTDLLSSRAHLLKGRALGEANPEPSAPPANARC